MTSLQTHKELRHIIRHWGHISDDIHEPLNEKDYDKLSTLLDHLLDIVGDNEKHALIGLVDVISHMISMYDEHRN